MEPKKVSKKLLTRLPVYLEFIKQLPEDTEYISATQLARALGLGHVMVRKDLAKVSDGGRRKLGYPREHLIRDIEDYLDMNRFTGAIVIGAGKLGQALMDYSGFVTAGLNILAGFDRGTSVKHTDAGKPIYPITELEHFCGSNPVRIAIITVPADQAQGVCDLALSCGVEAIWNFAPTQLKVPDNIPLQSEDLSTSLAELRIRLRNLSATQ